MADNICPNCGKPYIFVGDYFGGPEPWCTCKKHTPGSPQAFFMGWVCPKCGRVNAPWVGTCGCYLNIFTNTTGDTVISLCAESCQI